MLDTVLQIGKALRDPDNREETLPHHRYVERCPFEDENEVLRLRIPVSKDFEVNLDDIKCVQNERLFEKLFYLKYKSADADTFVKYIFGDIYFSQERGDTTGTSPGYYRLGDPDSGHQTFQKGSFDRGKDDAKQIIEREQNSFSKKTQNGIIKAFRDGLQQNVSGKEYRKIDLIERLLRYQSGIRNLIEQGRGIDKKLLLNKSKLKFESAKRAFAEVKSGRLSKRRFRSVLDEPEPNWEDIKDNDEAIQSLSNYVSGTIFIHFDMTGQHWYEKESAMHAIDQQFVSKFSDSVSRGGYEGSVLRKYIYKTMIPSRQLPEFDKQNQNRIRLFSEDELMNLFYAIDMAKTSKFRSADVKIIVLPRGNDMSADDVTQFMQGAKSLEEASEQEKEFRAEIHQEDQESVDDVLDAVLNDAPDDIIEFDLVFSEADSRGQDADLVELSGVSRSFLKKVRERIRQARSKIQMSYKEKFDQKIDDLTIYWAFKNLLSGVNQNDPRYQRHLYRMLPKIYSDTYHQDPMLLPALIRKTEKAVRDGNNAYFEFNRLNHCFRFLAHLQISDTIMKITDSESYKLGRPLGVMARPLRSRINSFEKNYVGNLRRRITTLDDLIEFKNEIEEMLVRQEIAKMTTVSEARQQLSDRISSMEGSDRIDKNRCALGFFESYFEPYDEDDDSN